MSLIEKGSYFQPGRLVDQQQRLFDRVELLRQGGSVVEIPFEDNWWKLRPGDMVVGDKLNASITGPCGFITTGGIGPYATLHRMYNPQGSLISSIYSLESSLSTPMKFRRKTILLGDTMVDFKPKDEDGRAFLFVDKNLTILRPRGILRDLAQKYTKYAIAGEVLKNAAVALLLGSSVSSGFSFADSLNREMYQKISMSGFMIGLSALFGASQCEAVCQKTLIIMGDKYRGYFPGDLELQDFFQRVFLETD